MSDKFALAITRQSIILFIGFFTYFPLTIFSFYSIIIILFALNGSVFLPLALRILLFPLQLKLEDGINLQTEDFVKLIFFWQVIFTIIASIISFFFKVKVSRKTVIISLSTIMLIPTALAAYAVGGYLYIFGGYFLSIFCLYIYLVISEFQNKMLDSLS